MWPLLFLGTSVLAAAAAAAATDPESNTLILNAHDVLHTPYADLSIPSANGNGQRTPSVDFAWSPEVRVTDSGELDFSAWDEAANDACMARLRSVSRSSHPSGNSICYNLAMLDVQSGDFTADLRLYRVSGPRGSFINASANDFVVAAAYSGAMSSPMEEQINLGEWEDMFSDLTSRADGEPLSGGPVMLQSYKLAGQIDQDKNKANLTMADLEALVLPNLALTAKTSSGDNFSTAIFPNEASFLVGAFSTVTVMSDWTAAQLKLDDQLAALRNGSVPFIMPGRHIMIFPIGLVITSVWLAIGSAVLGFGTYERMRHRLVYRKALTLFARNEVRSAWG